VADSLAIPEDEVVTEFLEESTPRTSYDIKFLKKELWNFIKKIENENIRELCLHALKDDEVKEHLSTSIAAQSVHHPYKGGLLTHIVRLLYIAESVCDTFNTNMYPGGKYKVNKDLLIAGVIFHDLYKIREYEGMDYSLDGNLVPHLPTSAIEVNRFIDQMDTEFPEEIRKQITHIILSHHNNLEWGSPVQPCTVEAVVLHYCDQLSAKVDPMLEALDALPEDEQWTDRIKAIGKRAYLGGALITED
jgi:3'-5' exoribonuclease